MSWPSGNDPWYLANPTDNNARRSYYGVNATPTQICDGTEAYWPAIQSIIEARLQTPSFLWMSLSGQFLGDTLIMTCRVVANQNVSGNVVIYFALLDKYTYEPNSPNGQPNHYHALLKFSPSASGLSFAATANDTVSYSAAFGLNPSWAMDDLDMACFVQDNSTHEVLQAICVSVPLEFPNIILTDYDVDDPTGNGDGRVDPGETGEMIATLENQLPFHDAELVVATLSTDDPLIEVTHGTVNFPDLPSGASATNSSEPFEFTVDPTFEAHEVTFTVTVTAEPGSFSASYPVTFMVGRPELLLVNDDVAGNYQQYYEVPLDSLGRIHDSWNQVQSGGISEEELLRYLLLIWYTGSDTGSVLSETEQQKIEAFLGNGGRLLLSSQNAGDTLGATNFYADVLHAEHISNSVGGNFPISGVAGDPISEGTSLMPIGYGGAANANSCANLNPISPAVGIYTYSTAPGYAALRFDSPTHRLVYMAFPLEAVAGLGTTTSRTQVLDNCLQWLELPVAVEPTRDEALLPDKLELGQVYPNPFNPAAEIEFALPCPGHVLLEVYDLQGRLVAEVVDGTMAAGRHQVAWNASTLTSGVYIVKLTLGGESAPKGGFWPASVKAVLMK